MIVRFSDVSEYVEELDRDPHALARRLVRVTTKQRHTMAGIQAVMVIATAKVISEVAGAPDYDVVRFERYVGDLWGLELDEPVIKRANELVAELQGKLEERGFAVVAGEYRVAEKV